MRRKPENFNDRIARLYPELHKKSDSRGNKVLTKSVTFQVTDACNLACSYCYQHNKGHKVMSWETAKKFVDLILSGDKGFKDYISPEDSPGIVLDFIGGEPTLQIELIDRIIDYFREQALLQGNPWAVRYMTDICSNGTTYQNPNVQRILKKHERHLSFSVSLDGDKALHDACRVFPDGRGSYDLAEYAVKDWMSKGHFMGSKITLSPQNVMHAFSATKHMLDLGYEEINMNCVFEEGWTEADGTVLYHQLKKIADYMLENDLEDLYFAMFEENFFHPKAYDDDDNWCWGAGTPVLTTKGYKPIEDIEVGDKVYTEDGSIHPVVRTTSHYAENMVKISASGMFDMYCTDDHKIFAQPFDYLGNKGVKHFKEYGKYAVSDLQNRDGIRLSQLPKNRSVNYDKLLAYLVGRYIGDGWDFQNGKGHSICCSFKDAPELERRLDEAQIDYYTDKNRTVMQYTIARITDNNRNKQLNDILSRCGHLAHGKRIPEDCFRWDDDSLRALLEGYISSDGYHTVENYYKVNTASEELALDVMLILRTLGFRPTCHVDRRAGDSVILGRKVHIRDRYEVYFYEDKRSRYISERDGKMWTANFKVEKAEPQTVYNITVDTNHSYIAGGIVSSNCGGTGAMLACDPDGNLFPCIRYMDSSLNGHRPALKIGDVDRGLLQTTEEAQIIKCMDCVTRSSQSTQECMDCPIAEGCAWCSGYNYEMFGTVNHRATFICPMHKARSLGNVYFWNKYYLKHNEDKKFKMYCPKEWAVPIIGEEEYAMLKELSEEGDDK
nr:MAG TPA_asm: radical SAM peptide maturase, CXXX-repeat target family [Caudoviricetes sp.]